MAGLEGEDTELRKALEAVYERMVSKLSRGLVSPECRGVVRVAGRAFDELLRRNRIVVAVFTSPVCPACEAYKPVVEWAARVLEGVACFASVDVFEDEEHAIMYGVQMTPTTIVFADGEPVDGVMGPVDPETLLEMILGAAERVSPEAAEAVRSRLRRLRDLVSGYM